MKKLVRVLVCVFCFAAIASVAFAGGGKVRGEKGQGSVNQNDANSQGNQN